MTFVAALFTAASLAILFTLAWLVGKPLPSEKAVDIRSSIENFAPMHVHRLPQLRQSFDRADSIYVRKKLSASVERAWRRERQEVIRAYLRGVAEDFGRLEHLARTLASLSPAFSRRDEFERVMLSMRFRINYRLLSGRLMLGELKSMRQLAHLTEMIGTLAARTDAAMIQLQAASAGYDLGYRP